MAFTNTVIRNSYGTLTIKHDITETNLITFYLLNSTDRKKAIRRVIDISQTTIDLTNDSNFDVERLTIDIKYSDDYNDTNYNGYLLFDASNTDNPIEPVTYNSNYKEFMFVNNTAMVANTTRTILQNKLFNGVKVEKAYKGITDNISGNYLDLGNHTITLTADNYIEQTPVAIYNGESYNFIVSQDRKTATLEININVSNSTLTISATAIKIIPIIYDFDDNIDYYQTDLQGNVIAVNPPYFQGNQYIEGYLKCKNNAIFTSVTCKVDNTSLDGSYNTEHNQYNFTSEYLIGSEIDVTMTARSKVISGVNVVQNLTNCVSSVSTLKLALGSHTITLTANNDTVFNTTPIANYNNVDYQFTLNNDSTVATLEITLDVANITLTITGFASVSSLQGISNFYKPTLEELQYISNHRYKWLSGEHSSERIDLGEYILNLKTVYCPLTVRNTEKVTLGGNELDLYIHPLNATYIDLETPNQLISGYYKNNFDVKNITAFYAVIPFYNIYELDKEYINKNIRFSFHIDLSNCDVNISVFVNDKLVDTLSGDCSIDIPYIMEKSLTPKTQCFIEHLKIVVNEKTNCNNRVKTIKNDLISNFKGFIKGDIITDSIKATSQELDLLKQLFNEGVYNG